MELEVNHIEVNPIPNEEGVKEPPCTCPKRTAPPPLPTEIPKEIAVEQDKEKKKTLMKEWILERYASSTFNMC